ncbi:helix-turn-helix domain-containing protein [Streptomyces flavofungini]|uniref:helix-turn-helix domain-containing protein n=1 Tax=Streptomyces flavofungini TaxID=68200 RepID=UPI0034DF1EC3
MELSGASVPAARGDGAEELSRVLREETDHVAQQFGSALRVLVVRVQKLGISQNQLGRRLHVTSGTLSKYVTGERVPDWDFVEAFLKQVRKITRQSLDESAYDELRALHERALFLRHPQRHDVQRITEALETSELQLAETKLRETELEQRARRLQERLDALSAEQVREREQHEAEQDKLRQELKATGARVEELRQRCADLEERLDRALERAAAAERTESAEPLVPTSPSDDREFGPDQVALLETLVEAYAQARTEEERATVYGRLRELPCYAAAAALALLDRKHPDVDARAFATAAVSGRPQPGQMRDAIIWFYRQLPMDAAKRLTRLVTLGMWLQTVPKVLESLTRTRGAETALAAVAEAACNDRGDFGSIVRITPQALYPVLAVSISDAALVREVHACEQALRKAERSSDKQAVRNARGPLVATLGILTSSPPPSAAERLLWLAPPLQDLAAEQAAAVPTGATEPLRRVAQIATHLRRMQAGQGLGDRDLAAHLLRHVVLKTKDPVAAADFLSLWEAEALHEDEGVTTADRQLVLSTILREHTLDAVIQLVTHHVALPPGSTDFVWLPERLELWQQAVDQLPALKRRPLVRALRGMPRSAAPGA